jgi:membrane protein implicated in regulation of membrane protease activity
VIAAYGECGVGASVSSGVHHGGPMMLARAIATVLCVAAMVALGAVPALADSSSGVVGTTTAPSRTKTLIALAATLVLAALAAVFVYRRSRHDNAPEKADYSD